jgi:uncharacterized repeat protein (TIGR01451 family)
MRQTATPTVNAGEAITYTLTYANTGGGAASDVTVTETLPAGIYYSPALDLGSGPKPTLATLNGDGTRTLIWNVGSLPARSGERTIVFTARPTLLASAGTTYTAQASVSYKNAGGACAYPPVAASVNTTIMVVPPTRDPMSQGFWKNHQQLWTAELLARIQATDQRYDRDLNGALSPVETAAVFAEGNGSMSVLLDQLLGAYFNLADRRINADTAINSRTAASLGLRTVRDAATYAQNALNANATTLYSAIIGVLEDINTNKIEVY